MTLQEVNAKRVATRAKLEELLNNTAAREMSAEETQMAADLQAEGVKLSGLAKRFEMLASFDTATSTATATIKPALTAEKSDPMATEEGQFIAVMRKGREVLQATDVPILIQASPTSDLSFNVPTIMLESKDNFGGADVAAALGASIVPVDDSRPIVVPVLTDTSAATTQTENTGPTESVPFTANHLSLQPVERATLLKVSQRAITNVAINLEQKVVRSVAQRLLRTQSASMVADFETSLHANTHAHILAGADIYSSVTLLKTSIGAGFRSAGNKFACSQETAQQIADVRADGDGHPLFDFSLSEILGSGLVIVDDLTDGYLYYGDFSNAITVARTTVAIQRLVELYSASGLIGFKGQQFSDWGFYSDLTGVSDQPVKFVHLSAAAGS